MEPDDQLETGRSSVRKAIGFMHVHMFMRSVADPRDKDPDHCILEVDFPRFELGQGSCCIHSSHMHLNSIFTKRTT